jgi:histidinol-phosphate aminotransferase
MEALRTLPADALRKYPDPVSTAFRKACAERYGCDDPDWVVVGNGMDELLALVIRTFVDPGEEVLASYPTYSLYEVLCQLHGCTLRYVDLDGDFQLPEAFYRTPARICLLTRPNAPSGVSSPRAHIERLCREFDGIVVIDEAYADFAEDNCLDFPKRFENAIVMRTFSKSFSLAGMRLGTAVARPEVIREFLKTKDSYNMDAVSQAAGLAAMLDHDYMESNVARVRQTRARLRAELLALGFEVPESQSNFLLARWTGTPTARALFEGLRARNILVRYFQARRLEDSLRISVGTEEECDALLSVLRALLGR